MFVNPTAGQDGEDEADDDMPFMELELIQHLNVNFSTTTQEVIDF